MEKSVPFRRTFFDSELVNRAIMEFLETSKYKDFEKSRKTLKVSFKDESWHHDSIEEFLSDYRKDPERVYFSITNLGYSIEFTYSKLFYLTDIAISAPSRKEVEGLFNIFEKNAKRFYIEVTPEEKEELERKQKEEEENEKEEPIVFIGHGRSEQWRDLKDHLQDKHDFIVEAYETGERAGHAIRDILESMLDVSSFAILVLTGEDKTEDGTLRARQNVIHEAGLFQGRLGFNRAIILLEEGTEDFSNMQGIHQLKYSKNNIKETFGDIIATLNREFNY